MDTHFRFSDLVFIIAGLLPVFTAILFFIRGKTRVALYFLIAGGFVLRLWMAFIDPYINTWDEQYHAMVAKNMMHDPFHPMLYAHPVMSYYELNWVGNSTWLHKPPLFLWQIALFMKMFGANYWVVRLPSILLTTLAIPVVFRIGKILSGENSGFITALLFTVMNLQINIVSGFLNTDHNDVVFMCYVLFSIWAWMEHVEKPKWKWVLLIGLFSGMAILVKWLPGLLAYLAWFIALCVNKQERFVLRKLVEPFIALLVTFIIAAPWFIYTNIRWPILSRLESEEKIKHLFRAVEDHVGPWYYHFQTLKEDYGWWMIVLLPLCISFFTIKREKRSARIGICITIIFVYVFYSFVPTRMPLFCLPVSPLLYIVIADIISNAENYFHKLKNIRAAKSYRVAQFIFLVLFTWIIFDLGRIEHFHTDRNKNNAYRPARIENKIQFEAAGKLLSPDVVVFNCGGPNGVAFMFYNGNTAYNAFPSEEEYDLLKRNEIKMAVFDDITIPSYLENDSTIIKLHFKLVRNGF